MKYAIACLYNTNYDHCIQKLIDDMKDTNVDIFILANTDCDIQGANVVNFGAKDIADKYVIDFMKPKTHWDYFTLWASRQQFYDYIWLIEDRVHYGDDWKNFFSKYNAFDVELLTQNVGCANNKWCWWKKPRSLYGNEIGYPNAKVLVKYRTGFLPCSRFSKILLQQGIDSLNKNKKAFREIFWPTLAKSVKTFDKCDIGDFGWKLQLSKTQNETKLNYFAEHDKKIQYETNDGNLKLEIFHEVLKCTSEVMEKLSIPFFLSSGTLLGYFREGNFIKHDYDIDIGIFFNDCSDRINDIQDEMKRKGFINYRNLGNLNTGYEMSFKLGRLNSKYAKIDIFIHSHEVLHNKKFVWWAAYKGPGFSERIKYRVSAFDIKIVSFNGIMVGIPINTELYLKQHYGDNWRIPQKTGKGGYHYASSPVSIVK